MTAHEVLAGRVGRIGRWLADVYALDLEIEPERFVLSLPAESARALLPAGSRSGVLVLEEDDEIQIGLHVDPAERDDDGTVVQETSHLVCLAWHASRDLPVSQLLLELQADVDRFVFARLAAGRSGGDALDHFERFRWAPGLTPARLERYQLAHERADRYCRGLVRRFPQRGDTPALLSALRRFYRASPADKLGAAA